MDIGWHRISTNRESIADFLVYCHDLVMHLTMIGMQILVVS